MKFTDFKISIEKSWGFTYQVLILIILGIVVISGVLILVSQLLKFPLLQLPSLPQKEANVQIANLQIPEGPIYGMWGKIISLKPISADNKELLGKAAATLKMKGDLGQEYTTHMSDDILINKYRMGTESSPPVLLEENIGWRSLKVGDRIYVLLDSKNPDNISFPGATEIYSSLIKNIDIYE